MSEGGYGGAVMRGTVAEGFSSIGVQPRLAAGFEDQEPLPADYAF